MLQTISQLTRADTRLSIARALASELGAEDMIIFLPTPNGPGFAPAPGFHLEVPGSAEWQRLLQCCTKGDPAESDLPFPNAVTRKHALAYCVGDAALVLIGGEPNREQAQAVAHLLPLIAAAFRGERLADEAQRALQRATAEAESANLAKDHFLSALSHDLRAPLNPVLMAAEAMASDAGLPDDLRDQAEIIRRNAQLEARLIDDLLDITQVKHGKLKLALHPVSLHAILSQTEEVVKNDDSGKQVTIEFHKNAGEVFVMGDAARLQQVFWNILKNAAKFTPQGGRVQVVTDNPRPGRVLVQITDSGMGIEPNLLPRIFDAFEQGLPETRPNLGGLGIGLAISRAIVELHGGSIRAESAGRGKGATFTVEFHTVPKPSNAPEMVRPGLRAVLPKLRLLLVEDHDTTREVLGRVLGRAGHKVYAAANSQEALQIVASAPPFDAVISDLGLPDQSGFTLMRALKSKYGLHGIAISGFGMDEDVEHAKEAGFSTHLTKPVSFEDLRAALDRIIVAK